MNATRILNTACWFALGAIGCAGLPALASADGQDAPATPPAVEALQDSPPGLSAPQQQDQEQQDQEQQPELVSENVIPSGSATTITPGDRPVQVTEANTDASSPAAPVDTGFWGNYFAILFGPSVGNPNAYQPTGYGNPDLTAPVMVKNYGTLGYQLDDAWSVSATAYWQWFPTQGQNMVMQDPFLRVSNGEVLHNDHGMFLYADLRLHLAVTNASREDDLLTGVQGFQVFNYPIGTSRVMLGTRTSERVNFFGKQGSGNDLELYLAPDFQYQLAPAVSFTLLYEMGASHAYGDKAFSFNNTGTDLEPGIEWDPSPNLMLNPYLNLTTGERISWKSSSIGMLLSWSMF